MYTVKPASTTTPTATSAPVLESPLLWLLVNFGLIVATGLLGIAEGDADLWLRNPSCDDPCACGVVLAVARSGRGDALV
jgi:hypothetical protein